VFELGYEGRPSSLPSVSQPKRWILIPDNYKNLLFPLCQIASPFRTFLPVSPFPFYFLCRPRFFSRPFPPLVFEICCTPRSSVTRKRVLLPFFPFPTGTLYSRGLPLLTRGARVLKRRVSYGGTAFLLCFWGDLTISFETCLSFSQIRASAGSATPWTSC